MRLEEMLDIAEKYGDLDDLGRWTFRDSDTLEVFVVAILDAEREAIANKVKADLDSLATNLWSEIRGEK
jgi:hypothetical protein